MTIEERMEKLESELVHAKSQTRIARRLIVSGFAGIVVVMATVAASTGNRPVADEICARKFILVDENGRNRATLSVDNQGPMLGLLDENERARVMLSVVKNGPWLGMYDENGVTRVGLSLIKNESTLTLSDENGKARVGLAMLVNRGPALTLFDEKGKFRTVLGVVGLGVLDNNGTLIKSFP